MPRPAKDLGPYKDFIEDAIIQRKLTSAELLSALRTEYQLDISKTTVTRWLQAWNICRQPKLNPTDELRERVKELHFERHMTDKVMVDILHKDGYPCSERAIAGLRRTMGLMKTNARQDQDQVNQRIVDALREEFESGEIKDLGRRSLYTHMRKKYHITGRDRVYHIAQMLKPEAFRKRRKKDETRIGRRGPIQKIATGEIVHPTLAPAIAPAMASAMVAAIDPALDPALLQQY